MQVEETPPKAKASATIDGAPGNGASAGSWGASAAQVSPKRKPPFALIGILAVGLALGGIYGTRWWKHRSAFVYTDDAQILGNLVTISPKIPGTIAKLLVDEGAQVKRGQILAKLDDEDSRAQLAQTRAGLAVARSGLSPSEIGVSFQSDQTSAQLDQAEASLRAARASLEAAQSNATRATSDWQRISRLYQGGGASKQQLDAATAARVAADAQVTGALSQVRNAEAMVKIAHAGNQAVAIKEKGVSTTKAQISQAMAAVDLAQLQVEHSTITSPVDGVVARRMVNIGERVQPGQGLLAISESRNLWIQAMVEETDIARIKTGEPVDITVDSFRAKTLKGHVALVGAVSGAQFSLLPQNNAEGNFTKVVQRIPVKIAFDQPSDLLKPGMSVEVDIATNGQ